MNQMIPEATFDFLPEGQLKWRCLEAAREMMVGNIPRASRSPFARQSPSPSGYVVTDYSTRPTDYPKSPIEVLILAQRIYSWVSGEEFEPSTDEDLREEFTTLILEASPNIGSSRLQERVNDLVNFIRTGDFHKAEDDKVGVFVNGAFFDCKNTADEVHRILDKIASPLYRSHIVVALGNAGIGFIETTKKPV